MPTNQTFESGPHATVMPAVPIAPPVAKIRPSQASQRGRSPVRSAASDVAAITVAMATIPRSAKRCVKFVRPYQLRSVASFTLARSVPSSVWTSVSDAPATTSQCHSATSTPPPTTRSASGEPGERVRIRRASETVKTSTSAIASAPAVAVARRPASWSARNERICPAVAVSTGGPSTWGTKKPAK